ncbi:hypothetical protein ACFOZY_12570 [Chungangia koreensis]|uniref:Diacylglycerol glucosyltransferase N-terminal domain-containing protein n=1 Tax=Chungangia koreensis TaxID=752657 RepID=A0ABV8X761_9LACT
MKKILFLPFLQMRSGHHQVAEALMDMVQTQTQGIFVKKVDLMSYASPMMEKLITSSYLNWINYAPSTYDLVYKKLFFSPSRSVQHSQKWYFFYFYKKLEQLLMEEKPDLIVCTHGFPSYLLSQLKSRGKCNTPVVNAYTDFFINKVWGREEIEYHFLPHKDNKEEFSKKVQIQGQRLVVTGIPVHQDITKNTSIKKSLNRPKILMSGGNNGLGGIAQLLGESRHDSRCDFYVLCGKNSRLFNQISSWQSEHIHPLPYISSREEMNHLYDEMDAIVTKPGGVTISEALQKRLPIFVHSVLPGQEEINLQYLLEKGLVFQLNEKDLSEVELLSFLQNKELMSNWERSIQSFENSIELADSEEIVGFLREILDIDSISPARKRIDSKVYHLARA